MRIGGSYTRPAEELGTGTSGNDNRHARSHVLVRARLHAIGKVPGAPVAKLPGALAELAEQAGIFLGDDDPPARIPPNLPAPGGPRDVNGAQETQAAVESVEVV